MVQEISTLKTQVFGGAGITGSSAFGATGGFGRVEEEYLNLRSRISELESRQTIIDKDRERLFTRSQSFSAKTSVVVTVEDPQVEVLRRELKQLIVENRTLVETIRRFRVTNY
jgi:hypothetical protein